MENKVVQKMQQELGSSLGVLPTINLKVGHKYQLIYYDEAQWHELIMTDDITFIGTREVDNKTIYDFNRWPKDKHSGNVNFEGKEYCRKWVCRYV